ncbi:MAG: FecR domain-containing protein [Dehalococcoidia bacterium]
MRKNKKLLLIVIVAILAVSIPVTLALVHRGQEPPNGGVPEVPSDTTPPESPPVTPPTLTMLSITEGNVFLLKSGTESWIEAQVGMSLEPGDIVKSGDGSSAEITFFDGSTIELQAGTEIEVASLDISTDTGSTTISLKQAIGTTISRVTKLVDPASSYEIETPAGVAVVRGSVMLVDVIEDSTTWITNQEGNIWVIANGVELRIPQGRKCIVISGQLPRLVPLSGGGGGSGGFSPNPDIAITKMPDLMQAHEGDAVTYTYSVTNTGNVPLSDVSITDDKAENVTYQNGDTNGDGTLGADETWIFTTTYNITTDDVSPLVNNAAAAGTYASSQTIIAWATASVDILRPAIAINKTAEPTQAHAGDTITYTYNITNPGNTPLSAISVTDDKTGNITYEGGYQSGDTNGDEILDIDETWVFTATYNVTADDVSPLVNTATATGADALAQTVTAQATATVDILRPAIAVTKVAEPIQVHEGDTITYTYSVTNTGDVPLSDVSITDDKAENVTYQNGDTNGDSKLDTSETWTFTADYTVSTEDTSPLVNTATATGADALAQTVTAQATASVTIIRLEVEITSPEDGDTITSRTITVNGTVSDLTVTEATIDINGAFHTIAVDNGSFSSDENVSSGVNAITVTATNGVVIASDMVTITVDIPTYGIRVELTWDTSGTDLDAHLIRPSGQYWAIPDDCYWLNKNPDWGLREVTEDNPSLDQDDLDGYGPENITLEQPYEQGIYQYKVHYWSDQGYGPSMATVTVWINDVKVAEYSKEMSNDEVWNCVSIEWPSGQVILTQE